MIAITMIVAAASVPFVRGTLKGYGFRSVVLTTTGIIQSTRYQAVMKGCAYQVTFDSTKATYQVATELASPCAAAGS